MSSDYREREATHMRRSDRAVEDERRMKQFLRAAAVGTLATLD